MSSFEKRFVALVSTPEQLAAFADSYKMHYNEAALEGGGYTLDNTARVLLFAERVIWRSDEDRETALAMIKYLSDKETDI
jgi:cytochrome oxidase Cu insertion factor (SCO1/SenC/PrrC family)